MYEKIYGQIKEIAESILEKQPYETIAREKLVKSLYLTNNPDLAKITGSKFLKKIQMMKLFFGICVVFLEILII